MTEDLRERLARVRLLALDVDGTLTDGSIRLGARDEFKTFDVADGLGLRLLMDAGVTVALITGRGGAAVARRAAELRIEHLIEGPHDKATSLRGLAAELGLERDAVAAMGDDLPDLAMFAVAGIAFAVADAAEEVLAEADWISSRPGGRGAAREAAELILKARGEWDRCVDRFRLG